ncbi:MAG: 5'-nucleotidase C-terminal domain-containing protein, partial [Ferruginibacter sp.]
NIKSIKKAWKEVKGKSDIVVALTHLALDQDERILRKVKHIRLIMGGHEHKHNYVTVRKGAIAKADANAKTMYRHLLFRSGKRGEIQIISDLVEVDTTVAPDPVTAAAVKEWEDKAYVAFRSVGLEPDAIVYQPKEPLDGTEASMRYKQTNLGNLIAQSMLAASSKSDAAVFNSGSVRIDDMVEGVISQLDIIRMLPFGGRLLEVELTGTLLNQMLTTSDHLKGLGGYLQVSDNVSFDGTSWLINNSAIDKPKVYSIIAPEYLFTGLEKGLEFLKEGNPEIRSLKRFDAPADIRGDIRLAVVRYLQSLPTL